MESKGFTWIGLLVLVGVMVILTVIIGVALNPARLFALARDNQRRSDLYSLTNAIYQYAVEHNGRLPDTDGNDTTSNFPKTATCIGDTTPCFNLAVAGSATDTGKIVPIYMAEMPRDPLAGTAADAQYMIYVDTNGRVIASASGELTARITATR